MPGGTHRADVPVLVEIGHGHGHGHRRQIGHRLDPGGQGQPDNLRRAKHIGAEQLVVGQHVVDQRGRMHDLVDIAGQLLPGGVIHAEARLSDIGGDHAQVPSGQGVELLEQRAIGVTVGGHEAREGLIVVVAADQADQLSICLGQPLQPLQAEESSEISVGAGEQNGSHRARRHVQLRSVVERLGVDELVECQFGGADDGGVEPVHAGSGRGAVLPFVLDVSGELA
ncbi:Uncharacterised protein [Mycobacteroides abscessus subsp. massiliense]|nr:Uncharacterised protein [Mycobacteroides abscessus subsp. massiliense]